MGNFEDAIYCWRSQAVLWPEGRQLLIASGGGALGVRLGIRSQLWPGASWISPNWAGERGQASITYKTR